MGDDITFEEIRIPNEMVGKVIGRGGATIRQLQDDSGCRVVVAISSNGEQTRAVALQGTVEQVSLATEMINQTLACDIEFMVPQEKIGLLIGKKGETIRMIQDLTGTEIFIIGSPHMMHPGQKQVKISGHKQSVEEASKKILEILNQEFVCGICMEVILEKEGSGSKFGILPSCSHCFCLSCISEWRKAKFDDEITKSCPECRVDQEFVIPSKTWVENPTGKKELVERFKKNAGEKDCRMFFENFGNCPNGSKCVYSHEMNISQGQQIKSIKIPTDYVGFVIGKKGDTIKNLQLQTNTKMVVMQENPGLDGEEELKIIGSDDAVNDAVMKVNLMIMELSLKKMRSQLRSLNVL
eukprot:GFUD01033284.1.p1 GENE.GFUD01033284.1~~GFUD01033284.1.p1  ORF type:complete len:353 (+),score=103.09 GFUD01033284.1:52-1110(+)